MLAGSVVKRKQTVPALIKKSIIYSYSPSV